MQSNQLRSIGKTLFFLTVLTVAVNSHAAVSAVSSRLTLNGNDSLDWATLGPEFTSRPGSFSTVTSGGLSLVVSKPTPSDFLRLDQGSFYTGNFAPGDALLWTAGESGPISLQFAAPVIAAGLQIQNDTFGPFTATAEAFDVGGISLGTFSFSGNSTIAGDNSAVFAGIASTNADIKRVTFNVQGSDLFTVNRLSLRTVVPEPGTALTGMACLFVALGNRSRRTGRTQARS